MVSKSNVKIDVGVAVAWIKEYIEAQPDMKGFLGGICGNCGETREVCVANMLVMDQEEKDASSEVFRAHDYSNNNTQARISPLQEELFSIKRSLNFALDDVDRALEVLS